MKYLDIQGLKTSVIGFGIPIFGSIIPPEEGARRLDIYRELGGNLIDTARVYADFIPGAEKSASEKFLGRYLREQNCRAEIRISTKGGHPDPAYGEDYMRFSRVRPECIQADLDRSLHNLDTDCIDFYWLHRDEEGVPVGELIDLLEENRRAGKLRCYGASNWRAARIAEANAYAKAHGAAGFFASQIQYSFMHTLDMPDQSIVFMDEQKEGDFYRQWGAPLFCFTSLASGYMTKYLSGADLSGHPFAQTYRTAYDYPVNHRRAARAAQVAAARGVDPETVGLAWLLARPFPTVALMQSDSRSRIESILSAADLSLTQAELDFLSKDE